MDIKKVIYGTAAVVVGATIVGVLASPGSALAQSTANAEVERYTTECRDARAEIHTMYEELLAAKQLVYDQEDLMAANGQAVREGTDRFHEIYYPKQDAANKLAAELHGLEKLHNRAVENRDDWSRELKRLEFRSHSSTSTPLLMTKKELAKYQQRVDELSTKISEKQALYNVAKEELERLSEADWDRVERYSEQWHVNHQIKQQAERTATSLEFSWHLPRHQTCLLYTSPSPRD